LNRLHSIRILETDTAQAVSEYAI